ncbi:1414_t:CDS:1, partial [Funneliformis caledonium]
MIQASQYLYIIAYLETLKIDFLQKEVNVGNYTIGEEGEVIEYLGCLVK